MRVGYEYCISFFLLLCATSTAFSPSIRTSTTSCSRVVSRSRQLPVVLMSSSEQSEQEPEKEAKISFEQAGAAMVDADEKKKMEEMGDFDENPDENPGKASSLRDAIRARAADLGVEKSVVGAEYIKQAEERAKANVGNQRQPGQLDLSQITTSKDKEFVIDRNRGGSDWDESMPTMFYDPEDDMTEEDKKEADPVGQLPIWEQGLEELKNVKWPTPGAATRDVALMFAVVGVTAALIIGADTALRSLYTDLGMIPRTEDIASSFQGIELPEGWTNGMNEDDIAQFQSEMSNIGDITPSPPSGGSSMMDFSTKSDIPMDL